MNEELQKRQAKQTLSYRRLLINNGIFERWVDLTYADYNEGKDTTGIVEFVKSYETNKKVGLLLRGGNGTGKSMLMNIAFKNKILRGETAYIVSVNGLVDAYIKRNNTGESGTIYWKMANADCLGIDDLGKEFKESPASHGLIHAALDSILRYRYNRVKVTWMTMNLSYAEISTVYSPSMSSLFKRLFHGKELASRDYVEFKQF